MNFLAHLHRRAPWLNAAAGVLIALLQRTPAVKVFATTRDYVLASRTGEVLRAGLTAAALGAMHSRAGATTFQPSSANPVRGTVGVRLEFAFTYTGTPSPPASFQVSGTLPPGLSYVPAPLGSTLRSGTPAIVGTPTQAGTYTIMVQGFNAEGLTNNIQQQIVFEITGGGSTAPTITTQPQSQTVNAGATVTFSVAAGGTPAPTFQWTRNGTAIANATASSLTLSNVQPSAAGAYAVTVTNSAGSVTSSAAMLTVAGGGGGAGAPAIALQPSGFTAAPGSTAAFTVVATGTGNSYQWQRGGTAIPGATDATLLLRAVSALDAGDYAAVVTNSSGSVTSNAAALQLQAGDGRLANLSVRANLASNQRLIVGFATNGDRSVLLRGIGPTLGAFGVGGAYNDPRLELYDSGSAMLTQNEDWNLSLSSAFEAVGAFPLTNASKDSALQAIIKGSHSAHLTGPGSGVVLVEVYDSGSGNAVRLVNVSARNFVGTGDNILIAGFVVDGNVAKTLLIRAVGPTLASFGVGGTLADPKLEIYNSAAVPVKIAENDNWTPSVAATFGLVGAFGLNPNSGDAALVITLMPGAYSAQVSGVGNGTGEALVEVYEVR